MSPVATYRWNGSELVGLDAGGPAPDPFILGETEPTPENSGAGNLIGYPAVADLTVINGDYTVTAGTTLENRIINGRLLVDWDPATVVRNVEVRGPASAPTSGSARVLVEVRNLPSVMTPTTGQVLFEHVTIRPQVASSYWNGFGRKGFKTVRCLIEDVNDGWEIFSTTTDGIVRVSDEGSCLTRMAQFRPDVANPRPETHNDGVQNQGSLDEPDFIGTSINARHSETRSDPLPPTRDEIAAIMLNSNTQTRAGIILDRCWLRGGIFTVNAGLSNGYVEITNSRFERPGTAVDGRAPDKAISIKSTVDRLVTGNVYMDNGATVPVSNG